MSQAPVLFSLSAPAIGLTFQTSVIGEEGFPLSKSANWEASSVLNRSSPVINYGDSGSMELSVNFMLFATQASGGNDPNFIVNALRSFAALEYPVKPGISPPPVCLITLGDGSILKDWLSVCSSYSGTPKGPWTVGGKSMQADVSLSFTEVDPEGTAASAWATSSNLGISRNHPFGGI